MAIQRGEGILRQTAGFFKSIGLYYVEGILQPLSFVNPEGQCKCPESGALVKPRQAAYEEAHRTRSGDYEFCCWILCLACQSVECTLALPCLIPYMCCVFVNPQAPPAPPALAPPALPAPPVLGNLDDSQHALARAENSRSSTTSSDDSEEFSDSRPPSPAGME